MAPPRYYLFLKVDLSKRHMYITRYVGSFVDLFTQFSASFSGILCSGLTEKTKLSFTSSNSSFIECVRIINPSSSNSLVSGCITTASALCVNTSRNTLQLNHDHSIISCEFTSISSLVQRGGVIYLSSSSDSDTSTLRINTCLFQHCNTTGNYVHLDGGGAIYIDSGTLLSITSTTFLDCSTKSYGGAVYAQHNITSSVVSFCSFIKCRANHGGGFMTVYGPTSSISSSRFISCSAQRFGGSMYHDSKTAQGTLILSDSLFTNNKADSQTNSSRGGGAFEDYRANIYKSKYSFSFFA